MFSNSEIPMFFICSIVINFRCPFHPFCAWPYSFIWLRNTKTSKQILLSLVLKYNKFCIKKNVWGILDYGKYYFKAFDSIHRGKAEQILLVYGRLIDPVSRVFANDPEDLGSIPGRVIPKTLKMVPDTSLLNTQQYKVRIEGKVEQSRKRSSALPYTLV